MNRPWSRMFIPFALVGIFTTGEVTFEGIQGCQPAKDVTKSFFDLADAACLTGLLDRTDLSDQQKVDFCGIESALSGIAHTFLTRQRKVVDAQVAARLARSVGPCLPVSSDAGKN